MGLVSMKSILDAAEKGGYGVGAFNVNNMEQAQGVMNAALETDSPLIYQVSRGALKYSDKTVLRDIILSLVNKNPQIPVAVHLDHGNSPKSCIEAIDLGFTSVMMDGSLLEDGKTPSKYNYNRDVTKEVVEYAHRRGVTVEAEIGCLGGLEEGHGSGEEKITKPEDVRRLYDDCWMDACAIAWGTSHGAYKGVGGKAPVLRHDVVRDVHELVPEVHLVSHGSSTVPKNLRNLNNQFGVIRKTKSKCGHRVIEAYGRRFDLETDNPSDVLALDHYIPGLEIVTMRSGWDDSDDLFFASKARSFNYADDYHSQLDRGGFILEALGIPWIEMRGKDNYSIAGYFIDTPSPGLDRWDILRTGSSAFHNAPTIVDSAIVVPQGLAKPPDQNPGDLPIMA